MITLIQRRYRLWAVMLLILFSGSGATCMQSALPSFGSVGPPAPVRLMPNASLEQIIQAINLNSSKIQSLVTTNASISIPGAIALPILRGELMLERPMRFRLRASTALTGPEVDLGSNEEQFWIWVKQGRPPALYVCRHDQFAGSNAQSIMPIEPKWLLAAFGIITLEPSEQYEQPVLQENGTIKIRSTMASASGQLSRVTIIDASRAWVLEQYIYDTAGTLLASAVAHSHRYYPLKDVSLPERVTVRIPAAQLALTVNLGDVMLDQRVGDSNQLFGLPTLEGYPVVDLGNGSHSMQSANAYRATKQPQFESQAYLQTQPRTEQPPSNLYPSTNQPIRGNSPVGLQARSLVRPQAIPQIVPAGQVQIAPVSQSSGPAWQSQGHSVYQRSL